VLSFLPSLKLEHILAGRAILDFLSVSVLCDIRILKRVHGFLCTMYHQDRYIPFDPKNYVQDEWRERLTLFVNQICQLVFVQFGNEKEIFSSTLPLALRNGLESLCLPIELTFVVVKLLDTVWMSKNTADLVQEGGVLFAEFVPKMMVKRSENILDKDKLLFTFAQKVFPKISSMIKPDTRSLMIIAVDEKMKYLVDFIKNVSDPQMLSSVVNDLILLYLILELIFNDDQLKAVILQNNEQELSFFKNLLDTRRSFGNVPQIDLLLELVKRIG